MGEALKDMTDFIIWDPSELKIQCWDILQKEKQIVKHSHETKCITKPILTLEGVRLIT